MNKQLEFLLFWVSIIILISISFAHNRIKKEHQKYLVLVIMIIFCFMYAYRTLGLDLKNYIEAYDYFDINRLNYRLNFNNLFSFEYEPLYFLVLFISKNMMLSFQQTQLIMYLFSSFVFYKYIIKKTNYPLVGYMIFMLVLMFHYDLTRFFVAMSFLCIGFFSKKKFIKALSYTIAFGFHYSSIFFPLLELVAKINNKYKKKILIYLIIIVSLIVLRFIDLSFLQSSSFKLLFKIQYYLTHQNTSFSNYPVMRIMYILINIYPIFMSYRLSKQLDKMDDVCDDKRIIIDRIIELIRIGILISLCFVLIFNSYQVAFRISLLSYFIVFIPLTDIIGKNIRNGVISINAFKILNSLLIYDLFMSFYYIGISIIY